MSGMEFTWRMAATFVWPVVVLICLIIYREWFTTAVKTARFKLGPAEIELNTKVDSTGREIARTLSGMPVETPHDAIPTSLVDLMPMVAKDRGGGIYAAFDLVLRALIENYPQLRRVPPSKLTDAMQELVDRKLLEEDVKLSVQRLYELLQMPEWNKDAVGDTRGYAYLMLAEGAIHGILRSANAGPGEQVTAISR
jgi:hypothetical protein